MEINFERIKEQYEKAIQDILENDTPENQKENLYDLSAAARVMCDTLHILPRPQAIELRDMIQAAREKVNK